MLDLDGRPAVLEEWVTGLPSGDWPPLAAAPGVCYRLLTQAALGLAHAHAKSGDAALISGYLGKSDSFDQAIGEFALAYADQNEKDHAALVAAVKAGRIKALVEEEKE